MLMEHLLICPWARAKVPHLGKNSSLAAQPLLGQSLLEYWLSHLACSGKKHVGVLLDGKPDFIRELAGTGARWGLTLTLVEESRELTPAQALLKYDKQLRLESAITPITVLDHFPGMPGKPLFTGYADFFSALMAWMPQAMPPDRVGFRQLKEGVWAGVHAHIAPDAELSGPCWIGNNAYIGAKTVIGPNAIVEDGAFIESISAVTNSIVGPDTYAGQCAEISGSLALGSTLVKLATETDTEITDEFVLCGLRRPRAIPGPGMIERLAEIYERNKAEASLLWKHFVMHKEG